MVVAMAPSANGERAGVAPRIEAGQHTDRSLDMGHPLDGHDACGRSQGFLLDPIRRHRVGENRGIAERHNAWKRPPKRLALHEVSSVQFQHLRTRDETRCSVSADGLTQWGGMAGAASDEPIRSSRPTRARAATRLVRDILAEQYRDGRLQEQAASFCAVQLTCTFPLGSCAGPPMAVHAAVASMYAVWESLACCLITQKPDECMKALRRSDWGWSMRIT